MKFGILLIILGCTTLIIYLYFASRIRESRNVSQFIQGILLGLSISMNFMGIVLTVAELAAK